jgi:hypothetical protein
MGISMANITGNKDFVVLPQIPISAVLTISTGAMTSKGAVVSLTATFRDVYGNGANAPSEAVLSNQQILSSVATFSLRKTAVSGEYVTNAVVTQPGTYTITLSSQKPASDGGGTVFVPTTPGTNPSFNINPGLALRATFVNVPPVWGLNESLTPQNVYVRVTDTLGAVTNVWDGSARATGSNGGTTREVSFLQRDQNFSTHSGIFDLAPGTAFAPAGRYVLSLFHKETVDDAMGPRIIEIPFRSYAAGRTMDVAPAPVLTSVAPMTTVATAQAWTLTVNGTGFTTNSRIVLNGVTQATTRFVSTTQLALNLPDAQEGTLNVRVLSNTTRGVLSAATLPVTIEALYKRVLVTVSGIPTSVVAGNPVPSVTVTVRDSATGAPVNLTNPLGRWFHKGVSDIPLVLLATGSPGVYSAMSTRPIVTEAATYQMELRADYAVIGLQAPRPELLVLGGALARVKVEEFLTAPAPLYTDILPGHRQGDTLPPFLIRGYDEFNNLTAITQELVLQRVASATVPPTRIPLPGRMIVRGLFETAPLPLDSVGEFALIWAVQPQAIAAVMPKGGAAVQSGNGVVPIADESGQNLGRLRIIERGKDTFEPKEPRPIAPILTCVNPYVVPTRAASTSEKIDPATKLLPNYESEINNRFRGYKLVWSDEFAGSTLDLSKWTIREGSGHPEVYTGEADFLHGNVFSKDNVSVQNNCLRLTAKKIAQRYPVENLGAKFKKHPINLTNGGVDGRYKADFRYAKVIVKFKRVPNFPFMHHGAWVYSSENGAPGLEIDFPDAANSPEPRNGNTKTDAMGQPIQDYRYTNLNNAHPRMAVAIINPGGTANESTAFSELSCAARPDSTNELRLDLPATEREY